MKKRIGILTMHDTNNYGSWLQTYALFKKIYDWGMNVEIIDYQCAELARREKANDIRFLSLLKNDNYKEKKLFFQQKLRRIKFVLYSIKKLNVSKQRYDRKTIKNANFKYDMFLIGSDLVWDTRITGNDFSYMLDFAEESKEKYAFSASLGYDELPKELENVYKKLLNRFDSIAVREQKAKEILERVTEQKIRVTCDPTMLLSAKEWMKFIQKGNRHGKYVLLYMPDEKKSLCRLARNYAYKKGYKVLSIYGEIYGTESVFPTSVSEFLSLIYYAQRIFTASYHGLLFSLYFRKQFTCKYRHPMNRMSDILERFEVPWTEIGHSQFDINRDIDYRVVSPLIKKYRAASLDVLKEYLF